jgi:hypothetical protein
VRFPIDPKQEDWWVDLSSDGTQVAVTRSPAGPLNILSLKGALTRQIEVKGWSNVLEFTWAANGKGIFVVSGKRGTRVVLHVDAEGRAQPLWESLGASGETLAIASPDGRQLAMQTWTTNGNMWMLENF